MACSMVGFIYKIDTDKSGVAMNVFVGSLKDPVDVIIYFPFFFRGIKFFIVYHCLEQREGMAHYLEHMLFLGTEKYPN